MDEALLLRFEKDVAKFGEYVSRMESIEKLKTQEKECFKNFNFDMDAVNAAFDKAMKQQLNEN